MHNSFETLQKRCRKYRMRRLITKSTLLLLPVGALLIGGYFYMRHADSTTPAHNVATLNKPAETATKALAIEPETTQHPHTFGKETQSRPKEPQSVAKDVNYNIHVDADYIPSHPAVVTPKTTPPSQEVAASKKAAYATDKASQTALAPQNTKVPPPSLSMSLKQVTSVEEMQRLYHKEPRYEQALKIAQTYYNDARYFQASLWAKKANILDRERDGAWILYAKSEYAKGHRQRAIEILKLYLANAHSNEGDALLRHWMKGM